MHKLILLAFLLFQGISHSQSVSHSHQPLHLSVFGGLSNYQGDLVDQLYVGRFTKAAAGLNVLYEYSERINLRGGIAYTKVTGNDRYNTKTYLQERNLNFQTSITELHMGLEIYTFSLYQKRWSPYVFGGLGLFYFDPYSFDSANAKVYLQPLGTEGQDLPSNPGFHKYSRVQLAVPFGGGFKYAVNDNFRVGVEFGLRYLFTDHLDDVSTNYPDPAELFAARGAQAVEYSYRGDEYPGGDPTFPGKGEQRGGANQKDYYYLTGLTLTFRLGTGYGVTFASGAKRKDTDCPKIMSSW
jgi:hypothetical protein